MTAVVAAAAVARLLLCNSVSCFMWKLTSWPRTVAITAVAVVARRIHAVRAPLLQRARYAYTSVLLHRIFIKTTFYDEYSAPMVVMTCVGPRGTRLGWTYNLCYLGHNQSKCCYLCRYVEFRSPRYTRCLYTTTKRFLSFAPAQWCWTYRKCTRVKWKYSIEEQILVDGVQ